MPEPDASTPRRARARARSQAGRTPTDRASAGTGPRALFWPILAIGVLVLLAAAPVWWPSRAGAVSGLAAGAALALGGATVQLLRRLLRESAAAAAALDEFAQRLREGDVGAALRAVRVDSKLSADSGDSASPSTGSWPAVSRFGGMAREVERALVERERRWQARMRLSADWHWETDAQVRFSWLSRDLASLVKLGVQPSDLVGQQVTTLQASIESA